MITENRFYNIDDALSGLSKHLLLSPRRGIAMTITSPTRPVSCGDGRIAHWRRKTNGYLPENQIAAYEGFFNLSITFDNVREYIITTCVLDVYEESLTPVALSLVQDVILRRASEQKKPVGLLYLYFKRTTV
jgi:hypothetical protein